MGSRTRGVKTSQNVWQLAHYFHTPVYGDNVLYNTIIHLCTVYVLCVTLYVFLPTCMYVCVNI